MGGNRRKLEPEGWFGEGNEMLARTHPQARLRPQRITVPHYQGTARGASDEHTGILAGGSGQPHHTTFFAPYIKLVARNGAKRDFPGLQHNFWKLPSFLLCFPMIKPNILC